jgi:ATP-binding cassette subfamily B (MDR/TAP) protein 1
MPIDSCEGNIEITNLNFAYPSRPGAPVLRDFNISIPAGKTTALVGASGSGKSTVVGLLERWYAPSSGSIMLDGIDISDYNIQWLRSCMRLVQQVSLSAFFCGLLSDPFLGANPVSRYRF